MPKTARRTRQGLAAGAVLLLAAAGHAGETTTPAQALDYKRIGDLHFSPDSSKLAYLVFSYPQDWAPHLTILDVRTGAARDVTPPKASDRQPQWSPDGRTLAFLSTRGGKAQVYLMPATGGDATALTARKSGVSSFHWSPDGRAIAYLAKEDSAADNPDGPQVADRDSDLERLWTVDPGTKAARVLPTQGYRIDEFQWQDRAHILLVATDAPRVEEFNTAIYSLSTAGGAPRLVARPPQPFDSLIVSPDGKHFALRATRAMGPIPHDIFLGTIGRDDLRDVSATLDRTPVEFRWHDPSTLWARIGDGFAYRLVRLVGNAPPQSVPLPLSAGTFDVARDGTIAYVGEDFAHLSDLYLRDRDGRIRTLVHVQDGVAGMHLAPTTVFKTRSFDGREIEAALVKPVAPPPGGKYPLVLVVHGGPSSKFSVGYTWETAWAQMLAAHGYEVLMVNPRGSDGYGEAFLKANRGDWGGGDFKDLMAVLDAVIARGETDPDRLGIGGWSYGAEMSEWAITQTGRFKAAVVGAGVFDQAAEFETEGDPSGDEWYFGSPWEHPEAFARNSPSTFIRNARTPTLIFCGEDDANNPLGQSSGLYRALKHFGVETTLVTYPGEGHSPRKGANNIDMFQRLLDWYDRHLKAP